MKERERIKMDYSGFELIEREHYEPLPCPWCQEKPVYISNDNGDFELHCRNAGCNAQPIVGLFGDNTKEEITKRWNSYKKPIKIEPKPEPRTKKNMLDRFKKDIKK